VSSLTYKQRLFVHFYLGESAGNATDAARRSGYKEHEVSGHRLLRIAKIRAAVDAKLDEAGLKVNEILARLSDMASADVGEFIKIDGNTYTLDLDKAKKAGRTHLIKKLTPTKFGVAIELHDAQSALDKLGRYRGLFKDQGDAGGVSLMGELDPETARRVLMAARRIEPQTNEPSEG
jgi:hypothetical protein